MNKENITYNEFIKLDIRIGTIVEAEIVEGSDKLLKLVIDFGVFKRQIIAGIKTKYQPSDVIDKQIPVIVNLEPRKLMGFLSEGMILAVGDKTLDAVYGCGNTKNPDIFLIFMNPTGKNVSSDKNWKGIKTPWLGTKRIWSILSQLGLLNKSLATSIQSKKPSDWDHAFSEFVYREVSKNSVYITNLSKATQADARHLPNKVFREYLELIKLEIDYINPKIIISFGSQVSSILLSKDIKISKYRKRYDLLEITGRSYKVFPVYYPVGLGLRNMPLSLTDINWIIKNKQK